MINIDHKQKLLRDVIDTTTNQTKELEKIKIINCIPLLRVQFLELEEAITNEDIEDIELAVNAIVAVIDGRLEY